MESLNEFFIQYGYLGMALASFLAGTFVPFSSEAVMGALLVTTGMDPWITIISGTVGNVAGTMFNYFIGRIWDVNKISKIMRIKEEKLLGTKRYVERKGSWIATFSFLPIVGSAIAIALGMLRANAWGVMLYSFIGKFVRYIMVAFSALALFV